MKYLSLILIFLGCTLLVHVSGHIRMVSVNGQPGSVTSRNEGTYDASRDPCGRGGSIGANGYTQYKPGDEISFVWEINGHPPQGNFKVAVANTDSELEPASDPVGLVSGIPHEGAGEYSATVRIPRDFTCAACTFQVWHSGYEWGTCHDVRVIPEGASLTQNGEIVCDSGKLEGGECKSSKSSGMNGAEKFFLGLFLFLLIAAVLAVLVFGALVVARRKSWLPDGRVSELVEKAETKCRLDRIEFPRKGNTSSAAPAAASTTASIPTAVQSPPPVPKKPRGGVQIGSTVQARYSDGQYYPATVVDMGNGQVLVNFQGYGNQEWLPVASVRQ